MAIRKPNGGAKAASTAPLTSVQDTRSRGNGNGNGNGERVLHEFQNSIRSENDAAGKRA